MLLFLGRVELGGLWTTSDHHPQHLRRFLLLEGVGAPRSRLVPLLDASSCKFRHVDKGILLPSNFPPDRILCEHAPKGYQVKQDVLPSLHADSLRLQLLLLHYGSIGRPGHHLPA